MSYARFGADGSDVYVFTSTRALECCMCSLIERRWVDEPGVFGGHLENLNPADTEQFASNTLMIGHLERHRAAGQTVPGYVFERLRDPADSAENEKIWAGYRERGAVVQSG